VAKVEKRLWFHTTLDHPLFMI